MPAERRGVGELRVEVASGLVNAAHQLHWVPDPRRETHLQRALNGVPTPMPVATATHSNDPAGPVWTLTDRPSRRVALHQLPSDHGPHTATNPHRHNHGATDGPGADALPGAA